jgi:FtsP/CotA-like multicopper oxidase with cupredoxin domain
MVRGTLLGCVTILWLAVAFVARADWDDRPGFDFHPQSTDAAPCGIGTPPRGHFTREVQPWTMANGFTLTVRQDAHRLCYVSGNVAEAPVIHARRGQELVIHLRNEITDPEAIDKFVSVAHLDEPNPTLPEVTGFYPVVPGMHHAATGATNLHVHGFAVPPTTPQDEVLRTCADPAVGPARCGRREITYRYDVPADMPAGLYWYHPHVHGEVQAQMLMGLTGAIVVEGPQDAERRAAGIVERIFIVRQTQDLDGPPAAAPTAPDPSPAPASAPPPPQQPPTEGETIDTAHELDCSSKVGTDEITLNGAKVLDGEVKDEDLAPVPMAQGTTQYWRILNAATDAYLDLALIDADGTPSPLTVAERDGVPLADDAGNPLPPEPTTKSLMVPPGGRIEFYATAPPVGRKAYLVTHAVDTGCTGDKVPERRLALVTAVPTATAAVPGARTPAVVPASGAAARDLFSGLLARPVDRRRTIALAEYPRPGADDQTDFYIAELKPGAVLRPYEMGAAPAIVARAGDVEEWTIENWTHELHAFHIHQMHFRVLSVDGKPMTEPPLLDIVNVPYARQAADDSGRLVPGRVVVKLMFSPELAGDIPFHCHLVDHEDNGMMGVLRVLPRDAPAAALQKAELTPDDLDNPPICRALPASARRD